jgi:hypothetical protein
MRIFSVVLQGAGQTIAQNKLAPSLPLLATADVVRYIQTSIEKGSVATIGSMIFTVSTVHTSTPGPTQITGCLDQSKLVQVRKDGSHFVAATTMKIPTLKMTATVYPGNTGGAVNHLSFAPGSC